MEWKERRSTEAAKRGRARCVAEADPDRDILNLHSKLHKAQSALLIQMRTEVIGLRAYLHSVRVPGIPTPWCECGDGRETPMHVLRYCQLEARERNEEGVGGAERRSKHSALGRTCAVKRTTEKMMATGRIPQFTLAAKLLIEWEAEKVG